MTESLLIVFVKTPELGKVKTRLAKTIGNKAALEVYLELIKLTRNAIKEVSFDKRIYFSEIIDNDRWPNDSKYIQQGKDLGERMENAFQKGFQDGYKQIIIIGTDLPDINAALIISGFKALSKFDAVFGPALDGGYYLIGLSKFTPCIFKNKPWSQSNLLKETTTELNEKYIEFTTLETLNDIDTFEDLLTSNFYKNNKPLQTRIKQLHD